MDAAMGSTVRRKYFLISTDTAKNSSIAAVKYNAISFDALIRYSYLYLLYR